MREGCPIGSGGNRERGFAMSVRRSAVALCLVALLAACGDVGGAKPTVRVPRLSGYLDDAMQRLQAAQLDAVVESLPPIRRGSWNQNGYVVTGQTPAPGVRVRAGSSVRLRLGVSLNMGGPWSAPPAMTTVPQVSGWSLNTAYQVVSAPMRDLLVTVRDGDHDSRRPFIRGILVADTLPHAGTRVRSGTEVVLVVKRS